MHRAHISFDCACGQSTTSTPGPVSPIGSNAVVKRWRCIDCAWLRLLWGIKREKTHTHTQTAICHCCRQPGHHLPLQMGQNTQNNRLGERRRDTRGTTAEGADINQWLSFCLCLSHSVWSGGEPACGSQMGASCQSSPKCRYTCASWRGRWRLCSIKSREMWRRWRGNCKEGHKQLPTYLHAASAW